jgi:hypothetical protein
MSDETKQEQKSQGFIKDQDGFVKGITPENLTSWLTSIKELKIEKQELKEENRELREDLDQVLAFLRYFQAFVGGKDEETSISSAIMSMMKKRNRDAITEQAKKIAPIMLKYSK